MVTPSKCRQCGAELPDGLMMGLCPNCIGRVVFRLGPEAGREPGAGRPHRLGDYELLEELGRGGMGAVYRARQLSLNRAVAVKLILAGQLATEAEVKRFRAEAEAAASLEHPNIIPIYEIGEWDGQHYFSMKLVEGKPLTVVAEALSVGDQVRLVIQVARAVHYAHQHGVLHRDLKPGNILVDAAGQPHIADFGLARRLTTDSDLTVSGMVLGSPDYMSPEQAAGQAKRLTTASDIYSLGAVLYRLLTGHAPFGGGSTLQTLQKLADTEPKRPRALRPELDRDLETICLKCLEKAPERRYNSAEALAEELERWQRGEPIQARPSSPLERAAKWARRRPKQALLLATCAALLLLGIGAVIWGWRQADAAHRDADRNRRRAEAAEEATLAQLREAYLAQAHANRLTAQPGRRFDSLATLAKASVIRPSPELRDEAIACLALTDARPLKQIPLRGHVSTTSQPDDAWKILATGLPNGEISVRRFADGEQLMRLPSLGLTFFHDHMALSHSGQYLGVRYGDGKGRVWNLKTGEVLVTAPMRELGQSLDFSPDETRVAVADGRDAVQIFALPGGRQTAALALGGRQPEQVAYSPDGHFLAVSDRTPTVTIFEADSGVIVTNLPHPLPLTGLAWNPDSRRLATACHDRQIRLWDAPEGRRLYLLAGHGEEVHTVAFHPAGDLLLSAGFDGVIFWGVENGRRLFLLPETRHNVKVSPTGDSFYALSWGDGDFRYEVCELAHGVPVRSLGSGQPGYRINTAAFSPDGRLLAQGDGQKVGWFERATGRKVGQVELPEFTWLGFDESGQFWSAGPGGLWRCALRPGTGPGECELSAPQGMATTSCPLAPGFAPGGGWLVFAHEDHLHLLETGGGNRLYQTPPHSAARYCSPSPDGRWLAAGNWRDTNVVIWERVQDQFREARRLSQADAFCGISRFSADGRRLAVHCGTQVVLYETADWQVVWRRAVADGISAMAFAPGGSLVAVRTDRRLVRLLSGETGELLATLETTSGMPVHELFFSADGRHLAATCDGTMEMCVWDLSAVRRELAGLGLDWNQAAFPAEVRPSAEPPVILKVLEPASEKWVKPEGPATLLP